MNFLSNFSRVLKSSQQIEDNSPHVSESKTVLDSGFHAVDYGFQVLDILVFVGGIWIPGSNR